MIYYLYRNIGLMHTYPGACIDYFCDTDTINEYFISDDVNFILQQYPKGISRHGLQYLSPSREHPEDYVTESLFELVRQKYYPKQPSRFQSAFACPDIESVTKWLRTLSDIHEIWTIPLNKEPKIFDSKFLQSFTSSGYSYIRAVTNAHKYWRQERSANPRLEVLLELPIHLGVRVPFGPREFPGSGAPGA